MSWVVTMVVKMVSLLVNGWVDSAVSWVLTMVEMMVGLLVVGWIAL